MTMIDSIIKWFKAPKTLYGIAGMIAIIIVLALVFAYWAGAIGVTDQTSTGDTDEDGEVTEWEEVALYHDEQDDSILGPGLGQVNNEYTSKTYEFPVEAMDENASANASRAVIITTHTGNTPRPDVDLYVYAPDGNEVGNSAGSNAEEGVQIDYKDFQRNG